MRWPLIAILLTVFAGPAMARDADAGREAFLAGDYVKARHILEPLADKGDAEALYWTGVMYSQGRGYRPDCQEAAYRYEQAARQEYPEAIFSLGFLLYYGAGADAADCEMIPDHEKAAAWLLRAARMGKPRAQFLVGRMYMDGDGLRKSTDDAFVWLEKSANAGIGEAQFDLGLPGKGAECVGSRRCRPSRQTMESGPLARWKIPAYRLSSGSRRIFGAFRRRPYRPSWSAGGIRMAAWSS
jgi:TPR repeat protein